MVEQQNQTITNYLAKYISSNQKDWDRWVPMFLLSYRTSKHETTGITLAEIYFGRDLRLSLNLLRGRPPNSQSEEFFSVERYNRDLQLKLEQIHSEVGSEWLSNLRARRLAMIAKQDKLFLRKDKRCGFLILEEKRERLLNCRAIGKVPTL